MSCLRGRRVWLPFCLAAAMACHRTPAAPPPLVAQVAGELEVTGLSAPVVIVRDRWGVPHLDASTESDLFFAQGFVQAEDRLFQMDLWRRAAQGRLSEVLGANFIERDAMTRRMQYRGDADEEWASYGPGAQAIAAAFVRGVNAWVALARERPPEPFVLAGWLPDFWSAADLLNRTDAFLASGDAIADVQRLGLSDVIADAIRRVGTPPFFAGLAAPVQAPAPGGAPTRPAAAAGDPSADRRLRTPFSVAGVSAAKGGLLTFSEAERTFEHPSLRYFVHLRAPGWNVIGAARPWLPGVAVGHNERAAWASAPINVDTQDITVQPLNAPNRTVVKDTIVVKGREEPFPFDSQFTPDSVVVASDRQRNLSFAVRWSGMEPGAAAGLAALALDRAQTWEAFRAAVARWKMPPRQFVYADADGNIGQQAAALAPVRRSGKWRGWMTLDDLPHAFNPPSGAVHASAPAPALASVVRDAVFAHPLGVTAAARARFNIGPIARPSRDDAAVRGSFNPANWDESQVIDAPGQSEAPSSPHFADGAASWSAGTMFPLVFTKGAIDANAESTLRLIPRR